MVLDRRIIFSISFTTFNILTKLCPASAFVYVRPNVKILPESFSFIPVILLIIISVLLDKTARISLIAHFPHLYP
jgi:hypothetical protein